MTTTDRYLMHKKASIYCELLLEQESKIKVASKMLNHSECSQKLFYENEIKEAKMKLEWLESEYKKLIAEPTETARPLTRKETIEAVSGMTNMAIAELTAKNN